MCDALMLSEENHQQGPRGRKRLQRTDGSIIFWRNTTSVVNDLDGLQSVIFKADLYSGSYSSQMYATK
jgi:hypothetical protein